MSSTNNKIPSPLVSLLPIAFLVGMATILSVPTLTYLPYCFFNLVSPVMSIFIAAIGYKIIKKPVNNL